jgi:N-acetylglutamate synthase-like GNAT family acetyltransferase
VTAAAVPPCPGHSRPSLPGPTTRCQPATPPSPLDIRQATAGDRQALADMLSRCTDSTRLRRFLAPLRSFPEPYLTEALAGRGEHLALIAETSSAVVALASCCAVGDGVAELAVLVEDASQRQGIGTCLLSRLINHADRSGLHTLQATVLAEQAWIMRVLGSHGTCTTSGTTGVIQATVRREPGPQTRRSCDARGATLRSELPKSDSGVTARHRPSAQESRKEARKMTSTERPYWPGWPPG